MYLNDAKWSKKVNLMLQNHAEELSGWLTAEYRKLVETSTPKDALMIGNERVFFEKLTEIYPGGIPADRALSDVMEDVARSLIGGEAA